MFKYFLPAILFLTAGQAKAQYTTDPSHFVPVNKHLSQAWIKSLWANERKVYKGDELQTIGMPCGGIAAGQLYVRGDGTLANWWIYNNAYNTGYGIDSLMRFNTALGPWKVCYQTFTPPAYIDQGFAITVENSGVKTTRKLNGNDFDDISFTGEYPIAYVNYASKSKPLPVNVGLEVFSPFIPMNAKESATPATVLKFSIKNTSNKPLRISLSGWLQNFILLDLKDSFSAQRRNHIIKNDSMTTVFMDVNSSGNTGKYQELQYHPYSGNASLSVLAPDAYGKADYSSQSLNATAEKKLADKLIGGVGKSFQLKPNEEKQIVFLLTWYFPNRPSYYYGYDVKNVIPNNWNEALPYKNTTILGNMYANWFKSSLDVAEWLKNNFTRLSGLTHLFHDTYYNNTTIPYWLNQRLLMPASTLATETCQWWSDDKFWAWEGVGSCVGTCTHVWNYEQALSHLFPELEKNIREKTDLSTSFQDNGSILARNGWGGVLLDGDAGTLLKIYRENLLSDNYLFLSRNWPKIKKAAEFLIAQDGNEDGLIEKEQANTYDIAFYGANTYVGGLYLAALKATAAMADIMNDSSFAQKCREIAFRGSAQSVARLWDGAYFKQDVNLKDHPRFQYADGCLSDQLFGQTWAHLTGLGYIYPKANVRTALQSIWRYNWAPDVGIQNSKHPPERVYADSGEAGLLICTWPKGAHMGENGVRYRDEVWTGIEYQVSTNMIYDGMINEALSIVKGVHNRYDAKKHNPWNEIECGDHYARAMASWGVLLALENYIYNGPEKSMAFSPSIQENHFESFFTTSNGWGNIQQDRNETSQTNTIKVLYGNVELKQFETKALSIPKSVSVALDGKTIASGFTHDDKDIYIHFDPIKVEANSNLTFIIKL